MNRMKLMGKGTVLAGILLGLAACTSEVSTVTAPHSMERTTTFQKATVESFRYLHAPSSTAYASPNLQELRLRLDNGRVVYLEARGTRFHRGERVYVVSEGGKIVSVRQILPEHF